MTHLLRLVKFHWREIGVDDALLRLVKFHWRGCGMVGALLRLVNSRRGVYGMSVGPETGRIGEVFSSISWLSGPYP